MKYITEYRDKELAKKLVADIAKEARADKNYRLMEFCGGHTHVISRYGLEGILPKNVRMIHGPGCPVCVMPIGRNDNACHRRDFKASQGRRLKELLCFLQSCSDASGHAPYPEEPGKSPN